MNAPLPNTSAIFARRAELAKTAARHSGIPVPEAIIQRAESDSVLWPKLAVIRGEIGIYGSAGNILGAKRYIDEAAAALIVARQRAGEQDALVSQAKRAEMKKQLDELEQSLAMLRGQLNACDEDQFDAEDRKRAERKVVVA